MILRHVGPDGNGNRMTVAAFERWLALRLSGHRRSRGGAGLYLALRSGGADRQTNGIMPRLEILDGLRGYFLVFMLLNHLSFTGDYMLVKINHAELGYVEDAQGFVDRKSTRLNSSH